MARDEDSLVQIRSGHTPGMFQSEDHEAVQAAGCRAMRGSS